MKKLKQELLDRGLLYQFTDDKLFDLFDKGEASFYCGFDPSADSLHLGNFIGFMVGIHLMRRGNTYVALTGGATGMIGDPGGKDAERNFLTTEVLDNNVKKISTQIGNILEKLKEYTGQNLKYTFANNKDFYVNMNYLDFLRDVGKYITVNTMMSKESVKKRIEDPDKSISYTEFSYQLMQGYDYTRLFLEKNVTLQIGGQDQWGNLVTGTELIRKKYDKEVHAMTWPLITDSTGRKFGKSEGNAMFLDKNKTTPYFIYQYFMNTSDEDLVRYMKMLTLIETEEVDNIYKKHMEKPENREGQKILAFNVVEIIHGTQEAIRTKNISDFMFGDNDKLKELEILPFDDIKVYSEAMGGFKYNGENLFETIVKAGLADSNSEAREAVKAGSIFINEEKVNNFDTNINTNFINDKFLLLRKGKKNYKIIYR